MKSLLVIAGVLLSTTSFATEARKPASLGSELVATYVKTADLLAQARNQNLTCDLNAYQSEIIETLRKTDYNSDFSPNMITTDIKTALAGTIFLKQIMGEVKLENPTVSEFQKALTNSYFESPAAGVYGPQETFILKSGGVIELTTLQVLNEEPWSKWTKSTGTWGVQVKEEKGNKITRIWFKIGNKTRAYRLNRTYKGQDNGWILESKPKNQSEDYYRTKFYNGHMSECEA